MAKLERSGAVYQREPQESYARILAHLRESLPAADNEAIEKILQ